MRIVFDTNVLVRAIPGSGSPAREALIRGMAPPSISVSSSFILSELARVLRYERLVRIHGLSEEEMNAYVNSLQAVSLIVPLPKTVDSVITHDPDDDPVLATAVSGRADVLCTKDRHFYQPEPYSYCINHNIKLMDDVELLDLFRNGP